MPTYLIEREIPGAGSFTSADLRELARRSNAVLEGLGSGIAWLESHVTDDKIYCLIDASSEELIRRHAELGGLPASSIACVRARIGPPSAE
jgi:hypothetical protein